MSSGSNPPFYEELTMRQVISFIITFFFKLKINKILFSILGLNICRDRIPKMLRWKIRVYRTWPCSGIFRKVLTSSDTPYIP